MTQATRRGVLAVVTALLLLALGVGAAGAIGDALDHAGSDFRAATTGVEPGPRDLAMAWNARILLVLAAAWVAIGIAAARTSLVRRPGAAAARATWIAGLRPWRARESTLGMLLLDRWLIIGVPMLLLVATRAVQTAFHSWIHLAVTLGTWIVFLLVVRVALGRLSPWPVLAAIGGVVVLRCLVALAALAISGPSGFWSTLWSEPVLRSLYLAVALALFVWTFVVAAWSLVAQVGGRRATGFVVAGVGAGLLVPAVVIGAIGLETVLTAWNEQVGLLAPASIFVIATEIPASAPWYGAAFGGVLLVAGGLLGMPRSRGAGQRVG